MKRDGYLHILRFQHVSDYNNEPDIRDENSDRLWKMRNLFEVPNKTFSKLYSHIELLPLEEVIM